jgi:ribosome-binding protein aMBF1 (putative translation factor)
MVMLADAIRAFRVNAGISQRELARRLGKPPSFVNKIEMLDIVEFVAIARAMGATPEVLLKQMLVALPETPTI